MARKAFLYTRLAKMIHWVSKGYLFTCISFTKTVMYEEIHTKFLVHTVNVQNVHPNSPGTHLSGITNPFIRSIACFCQCQSQQ